MVVALIKRANTNKFKKLLTSIRDQHSFKIDFYPKTLDNIYKLLENRVSSPSTRPTENTEEVVNVEKVVDIKVVVVG